jgi:hypothetical protein
MQVVNATRLPRATSLFTLTATSLFTLTATSLLTLTATSLFTLTATSLFTLTATSLHSRLQQSEVAKTAASKLKIHLKWLKTILKAGSSGSNRSTV